VALKAPPGGLLSIGACSRVEEFPCESAGRQKRRHFRRQRARATIRPDTGARYSVVPTAMSTSATSPAPRSTRSVNAQPLSARIDASVPPKAIPLSLMFGFSGAVIVTPEASKERSRIPIALVIGT
jgi:hypothetical protein